MVMNAGKIAINKVLEPMNPANKAPIYPNSARFSIKIDEILDEFLDSRWNCRQSRYH